MDVSIGLARFWGIIMFVLSVSILVHVKFYARLVRGFQDEAIRFLYFFVVLVIGAVSVAIINQWSWDYRGLVTLLGWGSLLKGVFGILLLDVSNRIIQRINFSPAIMYPSGVISLIVGCYLLFVSFGK